MTAPVRPLALAIVYDPDAYADKVTVTTGDSTHAGVRLYTFSATYGWEQTADLASTAPVISRYYSNPARRWRVTAYNADGESPFLELDRDAPAPAPPQAPTRVTASRDPLDPALVNLSWTHAGTGLDGFKIRIGDDGAYAFTDVTALGTLAPAARGCQLTGVSRWKDRAFQVVAIAGPFETASLTATVSPALPALVAPTGLTAALNAPGEVTLRWQTVPWSDAPNFVWNIAQQEDGVTYTDDRGPVVADQSGVCTYTYTIENRHPEHAYTGQVAGTWDGGDGTYCDPVAIPASGQVQSLASFSVYQDAHPTYHSIAATWGFDAPDLAAVPLEIWANVDGGEAWYHLLDTDPTTYPERWLHGNQCASNNEGPLDTGTYFLFSDAGLHTLQLRARSKGSADPWVTAQAPQPVLIARSPHFPLAHWEHWQRTLGGQVWYIPAVRVDYHPAASAGGVPVVAAKLFMSVDDTEPYALLDYPLNNLEMRLEMLYAGMPNRFKDGQPHTLKLIAREFDQNGALLAERRTVNQSIIIPTRNLLMATAPTTVSAVVKARGKDPVSGIDQLGNDFFIKFADCLPTDLRASFSIDGGAYSPATLTDRTIFNDPLKVVQVTGQLIPQDGLTHSVQFKVLNHDSVLNEDSAEVVCDPLAAVYELAMPTDPTGVTATLVRNRIGSIPDQVQIAWTSAEPVAIYCIDNEAKKHLIYESRGAETAVVVETISRFGTQDGNPHAYRFGVQAFNRSSKSGLVMAPGSLSITAKIKAVVAPSPDDVAGTAVYLTYNQFVSAVAGALGATNAVAEPIIAGALVKIKDVLSKGGSVKLDDFGTFAAKWTKERLARNPATGQPIIVPPYRSLGFNESTGFKKGVREGTVLTDAQAKPATP